MRRHLLPILFWLALLQPAYAGWQTHLSYNDVSQIAMAPDRVYGLASGSLFSVDKQTDRLTLYSSLTGLHSTNISYIYYDEASSILIIAYTTGKIDLLTPNGVEYVSGLYDKDMTASKRLNNICVHNGRAYMAMPFGICMFSMRNHTFVDTYYVGENAAEVDILDVKVQGDTLYGFGIQTLYCGCLRDNLTDYVNWRREPLSDRITRDTEHGKTYTDLNGDVWAAGGTQGITRQLATGAQVSYKPDGPLNNIPYRLFTGAQDRLYMLSGGRWAVQYDRPGNVMLYEQDRWTNIPAEELKRRSGKPVEDLMNVAEDPADPDHYFITSYGAGVCEFYGDTLVRLYNQSNSSLRAAASNNPDHYTRTEGAVMDENGYLYVICTEGKGHTFCIRDEIGVWYGINFIIDGVPYYLMTPGGTIIDRNNKQHFWVLCSNETAGILLHDDNGTPFQQSDDRNLYRNTWIDQHGATVKPEKLFTFFQDRNGVLWVGGDDGVFLLPPEEDFFVSERCLSLSVLQPDGSPLTTGENIQAVTQDIYGNIWIGSSTHGVYVLSEDRTTLLAHYTVDNSPMPGNSILALAACHNSDRVYIGTSEGLISHTGNPAVVEEVSDNAQHDDVEYGIMGQWKMHFSYTVADEVAVTSDRIFAIAEGALFSVDRDDRSIRCYDKTDGLNGSVISHIAYDDATKQLLLIYSDGMIDLLRDDHITAMPDIYLKGIDRTLTVNEVHVDNGKAYLSMNVGIVVLNLRKQEVEDTYYIGHEAGEVDVTSLALFGDSLFATAGDTLYSVCRRDNMLDYASWHRRSIAGATTLSSLVVWRDSLRLLADGHFCTLTAEGPLERFPENTFSWTGLTAGNRLMLSDIKDRLFYTVQDDTLTLVINAYPVRNALYDASGQQWWLAAGPYGLRNSSGGVWRNYAPDGPYSNEAYRMQVADGKLFVAAGGRWAVQWMRPGHINTYDEGRWNTIGAWKTNDKFNTELLDVMCYAVDPNNNNHFYAASYGEGVVEFRDGEPVMHYTEGTPDCPIRSATTGSGRAYYVRTDGAVIDANGYLWVLSTSDHGNNVNILTNALSSNPSQRRWVSYNLYHNGQRLHMETPGRILIDSRNPNWKWIPECRDATGITLLDDGGTPLDPSDDLVIKRLSFIDQNGATVKPEFIYCLTQDRNGAIWVGTEQGLFLITGTDYFSSAAVRRVLINRNDGSGLGDYLLAGEQINDIAIDGANRKWIATANSGIFVISNDISADGIETIAHFTADNSSLPSSEVISLAINGLTGEVFAGTGKGIASYQSDASAPRYDMSGVYAFPNPVRRNFGGMITITGLMEGTQVHITDEGGNLVCRTFSNGGTAVWDGNDGNGHRVSTGVYNVFCTAGDGTGHTVVKILVVN